MSLAASVEEGEGDPRQRTAVGVDDAAGHECGLAPVRGNSISISSPPAFTPCSTIELERDVPPVFRRLEDADLVGLLDAARS
jgi:hypothetical protein